MAKKKSNQAKHEFNNTKEALNHQVANFTVLWTKLHNYHWYVKGSNFFSLHTKFEELYNSSSEYVDELAQRLLAIGGEPVATMKESLKESCIKEGKYNLSAEEMVKDLTKDFEKLSKELIKSKTLAEEANDDRTADLFIGINTEIEKNNWMLKSFLGNDVE